MCARAYDYVVVLWMATPGPTLPYRARRFLFKGVKVFICGVMALVSVSLCVFTVHGLSFREWGVWLAGGKQSSFPFSLECSSRGKKRIGEPTSTTFMLLKVGT